MQIPKAEKYSEKGVRKAAAAHPRKIWKAGLLSDVPFPKSLTVSQKRFLYAMVTSPNNLSETARKSDVPYRTLRNWMKSDGDFKKTAELVKESTIDWVEGKLLQHVAKDNLKAICFWLNANGKNRGYGKSR